MPHGAANVKTAKTLYLAEIMDQTEERAMLAGEAHFVLDPIAGNQAISPMFSGDIESRPP
jgi:hypothetical protein